MVMRSQRVVLAIVASLLWNASFGEAIRGERRLRSNQQDKPRYRYLKKWGGLKDNLELDDPEEQLAFVQATGMKVEQTPKGGKKDDDDSKEEESKASKKPKGSKGKDSVSLTDCDDPNDPDCASLAADQDDSAFMEDFFGEFDIMDFVDGKEEPLTTAKNTMERELTPFKIAYSLSTKLDKKMLDEGDYAELADNTQLHLTTYFQDYFKEEPANFDELIVRLHTTGEDLVVRFVTTGIFEVPGSVPTMSNLFERITEAFSGEEVDAYIELLNDMGEGNPFKNTKSIAVINESPSISGNSKATSTNRLGELMDSKATFLSIVIGAGVLLLVIIGLIWVKLQMDRERNQADAEKGDDSTASVVKRKRLTRKYLNVLRRHKKDLDEETSNDDEETRAADNRNSLDELREAMKELNSLTATHTDYENPLSVPAPPSQEFEEEEVENGSSVAPFDERKPGQKAKDAKKESYMKYLDIVSNSFDDDLRN